MQKSRLIVSLAALAVLAAAPAQAACEQTKRRGVGSSNFKDANARTIVANASSNSTLIVEFWRGGDSKATKYAKPGQSVSYNHRLAGADSAGVMSVQIAAQDRLAGAWCSYQVREGNNNLIWNLPNGAATVCPKTGDLDIACSKRFKKNRYSYETIFTVR